ncbi:MAG: prolyl oligopeptidase family serine peptidase [Gemmatimonadota bacterium]|jgi:dipeptidyl aminopeptidase/acylaminoacyl peptidase
MIPRRPNLNPIRGLFLVVPVLLLGALPLTEAQGQSYDPDSILVAEGYITPPDTIVSAALAPRWRNFSYSNPNEDGSWYLETVGDGLPHIAEYSKAYHELGGEFIDFAANRDRGLTTRNDAGLRLRNIDGETRDIQVPDGARVSNASFSPDGRMLAFFAHFDDATHIYVADVSNGRSRSLTRNRPVLATAVTSFSWTEDSRYIITVLVPDNRPPMPTQPPVWTGPEIKVTEDGENRVRTYPSLMGTPYEKDLLEWHMTGQLARIEVENRRVTEIGDPTMIRSVSPSHDGEYFRVTRTVPPFSYIVPASSAGRVEELWDIDANVLDTLDETPLNTGISGDDDDDDEEEDLRRSMTWAPDGNGIIYLEQEPAPDSTEADSAAAGEEEQEGGRQRQRRMDRVIRWVPPFGEDDTEIIYETATRMSSARFNEGMTILFGTEGGGGGQRGFGGGGGGGSTHTYAVFLDDPEEQHTITRWNSEDFYENPGSLVSDGLTLGGGGGGFRGGGGGGGTVRVSADGEHVFLRGTQYDENPEEVGPYVFIDQVNIRNGEKTRIYEGDNDGVYESPVIALDLEAGRLIVERESPTEISQNYIREGESLTQITDNVDYTPDLTRAEKHRFRVTRPDGFSFPVTVTLPESFRPGTPLPAMFWFYPREYTDQESYDERFRNYNKNTFNTYSSPRSMAFLTRVGYVLVEPESPIVGDEGVMNNNYVHDLRNNLSAVIDTIVDRGWVDRGRIGIGGHSYGAFSTANAMVHTPFFKAGIAGDGNYNRTLTPLAFQSERRFLWEAPQVYLGMSPFLHANNLTGALLMYHGLKDQNVGTFTIHSPRMFEALNALGKDASMYLYPEEAHGPATEETNLDLWARWVAWLDKWVKNPPPPGGEKEEGGL